MPLSQPIIAPCQCEANCGRTVISYQFRRRYLHRLCQARDYEAGKRQARKAEPSQPDLPPAEIDRIFLAHLASVKADRKFTIDPWQTSYAIPMDPGDYPSHKEIRAVSTPEHDWKMASKRKKRKS